MNSNRRWRMWVGLSLAGALVGLLGCVDEGGSPRSPDVAEGAAQAPLAEQEAGEEEADGPAGPHGRPHGHHGPGHGPEHLLRAALHELELSDAQRSAIQGALAKLPERPMGPPPEARAVFSALAEGVRAGKVDPAALAAKGGGAPPAGFEEHRAAVAGALQALHATLTKEQRRALVDAVKQRMEEHGAPPGEHFGQKGARGPGGPGGPPPGGPLAFLLDRLDLTEAQRDAIDSALEAQRPAGEEVEAMKKRHEAMRAAMSARLEGFAADSFDAKAFLAPPEGADHPGPGQHLQRMAESFAVVVPLLQPAQREALAALLEQGPPAPPRGARGGHPGR